MVRVDRPYRVSGLPLAAAAAALVLASCNSLPEVEGFPAQNLHSLIQEPDAPSANLLHIEIASGYVETQPVLPDWQIVAEAVVDVTGPTEEQAQAFADGIDVELVQEGSEVWIRAIQPPRTPEGYSAEVKVVVAVPVRVPVRIRTTSGDVLVKGPERNLEVTSITGNITVQNGRPDRVRLLSANGNVSAHIIDLADTVDVQSINGRAFAVVERGQALVNVMSENGNVGIACPSTFPGRLDAETVNGVAAYSIEANLQSDGKRIEGVLGEGSGLLWLRTTNGNIDIQGL